MFVEVDLDHLPAEANVNASLGTLIKSNFVSVWESVNLFVWRKVLNSGRFRVSFLHGVKSMDALVVWGIEVRSFTFVWEFWGVRDEITSVLSVSVPEVAGHAFFGVDEMDKDVVDFVGSFHLGESLNEL